MEEKQEDSGQQDNEMNDLGVSNAIEELAHALEKEGLESIIAF